MSKISIHDIPIDTFMKYYFNDKDADFISKNARYQPKMVEWKTNKIFQFVFSNVDNTNKYVLKLPVFPDISSGTFRDIRKSSGIIFNTSNLKLISPTLKQNQIDELNKIDSYYAKINKIHSLDILDTSIKGTNNPTNIFNIDKDFEVESIISTAQQLYYNPINDRLTTILGNISLYQYYAVIANKYFYPVKLNSPITEISLNKFMVEYTAKPDNTENLLDEQPLDSYFPDLGYSIELDKANKSVKIYNDKINSIDYYLVINKNNQPIGKIYILPKLNTVKKDENDLSKYQFNDKYSSNKTPVSFTLQDLPLSPVMKYHNFMRGIKPISKPVVSENEINYMRNQSTGTDTIMYYDYIGYSNTCYITVEDIANPTMYTGLATKCYSYDSNLPRITLEQQSKQYIPVNSYDSENWKKQFGLIEDDAVLKTIKTNPNSLIKIFIESDMPKSDNTNTFPDITELMSNSLTDTSILNKIVTVTLEPNTKNPYDVVYYNSVTKKYETISSNAKTKENIEFSTHYNKDIFVYPNPSDNYKSVACKVKINSKDNFEIFKKRDDQNNFRFSVNDNCTLSVEYEHFNIENDIDDTIKVLIDTNSQKLLYLLDNKSKYTDGEIVKVCPFVEYDSKLVSVNLNITDNNNTKITKKIDITNDLAFSVKSNYTYSLSISTAKIDNDKENFIYFMNNIYNKDYVEFYNTNDVYTIKSIEGNIFNNFLELVKNAPHIINNKINYSIDCNKSQLKDILSFLNNKRSSFFYRYNNENIEYYLFKLDGTDGSDANSTKWDSIFALRIITTNNVSQMTVEVLPILVYLQIILNYLHKMFSISQNIDVSTPIVNDNKKYIIKKHQMTDSIKNFYNIVNTELKAPQNVFITNLVNLEGLAGLFSFYSEERLSELFNTKINELEYGTEMSQNIVQKERNILKKKSIVLLNGNQNSLANSCSSSNLEILVYCESIKNNLINILQSDIPKINDGGYCFNNKTNSKYFGFISGSDVENSFIDYYGNNISTNVNTAINANNNNKLTKTEMQIIEQNVLNENPINKILNYKEYFTDNSKIKNIILSKENNIWLNTVADSKEITNYYSKPIVNNRIKYYTQYIPYTSIFNKAKELYLEYTYSINKDNDKFFKSSVPAYLDSLNYITENNKHAVFNNKHVLNKKKIIFSDNANKNKNIFINLLKTKFSA